jgi:acetyltransferase-like isoleucine patch superfamily enzyme
MIHKFRQFCFYIFRKLIPIHWIEDALKKEKVKLYAQGCELGENAILLPDARVVNFQYNPANIKIGKHSLVRGELLINAYGGSITIGDYSSVGEFSRVWSGSKVTIGNSVHISHGVNIIDCNTHSLDPQERHNEYVEILNKGTIMNKGNIGMAPIVIEDFVWISFNATVLKGVTIGKGAVVAANSLVTKDVEPFTLVGGVPAAKIKSLI